MNTPVFLIGMPGCGKSTLGRMLAARLCCDFTDADNLIPIMAGQSIKSLFEKGEDFFRAWETRAVIQLTERGAGVYAMGGGVVQRWENVILMRDAGRVLYIDRPIGQILSDVDTASRPLLADGEESLLKLYRERAEKYRAAAHAVIDNTGTPEQAIEAIAGALTKMEVR